MSEEFVMRARLQQVAAYRELQRSVRRSGRENVVYALVMLAFAYFVYANGGGLAYFLLYSILAAGELLVGLFKWAVPVAEGLILDGLVLLVFVAFNFGISFLRFQNGLPVNPVAIVFGVYMLFGAVNRFKSYGQLRRLFADRPSAEHIAWFDELVREIQFSDPHSDGTALDLPTRPRWKAKLLGAIAFFVSAKDNTVWVAGPDDFTLKREKTDHGTGLRRAVLHIYGEAYPEFDIDDASWANYTRWMATQEPGYPA